MKVATWNVGSRRDHDVIRGLVRLVKNGADIAGLQECGDRGDVLEQFCERTGWRGWLGDGSPGATSTPILWNPKRVHVPHVGTRKATDATDCGRLGAGPNVVKAKVWNHVRVWSETLEGDPFVFINGHLPASLYLPRRRALARKQLAVLAEMVERREDRDVDVVVAGDFNMRPTASLTKPLRHLGMKQRTKAPTHGRRTIDHVWTLGVGGSVEVLEMPSDHNAALFSVR